MAIVFSDPSGGTSGGTNVGASSYTYSFTNTTGADFLSVGVFNVASDGTPTVTYGGVSMTQIDRVTFSGGTRALTTFLLSSPASGANDVVVTQTGTTFIYSLATSFAGSATSGQPDSHNTSSTAGATSLACSTTVVSNNCWLVGFAAGDNGNNPTAGSGTLVRSIIAADKFIVAIDSNGTVGTGSQTLNVNISPSQSIAMSVFSVKPPSASSNFFNFM